MFRECADVLVPLIIGFRYRMVSEYMACAAIASPIVRHAESARWKPVAFNVLDALVGNVSNLVGVGIEKRVPFVLFGIGEALGECRDDLVHIRASSLSIKSRFGGVVHIGCKLCKRWDTLGSFPANSGHVLIEKYNWLK
eukprot:5751381-Pleurochrysis_carterae.AAC.1